MAGAVLLAVTPATAVLAAPLAYITSSFTDDVKVIDTTSKTIVTAIPVGSSPFGVAVHPAGSHVYVGNWGNNTVSVISTATNTVIKTVGVEQGPFGVAIHPAGTHAYVANQISGTVSVIETAGNTVVGGPITVGIRPIGVVVNPAGTRVYVTNQWSDTVSVIDTATQTVVGSVGVGVRPVGIAITPNGARLYVANSGSRSVSVIETATHAVSATLTVGSTPYGIAVHPSGSRVYVGNKFSGTISVIDNAAAPAVLGSVPAAFGLFGLGVTPSGSHVYAASEDDNRVLVMDTSTNIVTDRIPVSSGPAAFGSFFASASCDTSELEAALATARAELATCRRDLEGANLRASQWAAAHQALTAENERLRRLLSSSSGLIDALVSVLFGDRPESEVAAAVRDVTSAQLAAAQAVAPRDPRLRPARRAFDAGLASMSARDWKAAIRSFRDAYTTARQIQADAGLPSSLRRQ